ncbi:hypothetical protein [Streptomyces caniferus]|uniref:hypothetical protein n=1 Tax=Streptomyces caniferus TaxID=285557 RepID=UPI00382E21C2
MDAYDVEGHAALVASPDTPVTTGEMLTGTEEHSVEEHPRLIEAGAADSRGRMRRGSGWTGAGRGGPVRGVGRLKRGRRAGPVE